MATENKSEILPWEPSPLEKQRQWLQNKMLGIGSFATEHDIPFLRALDDPYHTRNIAENLTFASEFIPGFGDVQGFREGRHMMGEGSPKLGATVMGLSLMPLVPISPIKKAIQKGVKVAPTKVVRTNTGNKAVEEKLSSPNYTIGQGKVHSSDNPNFDLLKEGRLNFETNAERQLLSNPDFANPNKAYSVDGFIKSTVANSPKEIRTTVKSQLDEWVSPALRGKKATIQDILDDIGKNKPTIKENYMDDATHRYTRYMPNIPTNTMPTNPVEALETIHPLKYTERSFSVHSPNQGKLFTDPGHTEVSQGAELRNTFQLNDDVTNATNRIFTTRSGLYDIDGVKTYIPAEGQSGIYRMGTSKSKAAKNMGLEEGYTANDFQHLIETGQPLRNLEGTSKIKKLEEMGGTLDEWNDLVSDQKFDLDVSLDELKQRHNLPDDVDWHNVDADIFEQAQLLTQDNAIEYGRKFSEMFGKRSAGIEPPLFKEWFPMHMKTSINDAVEVGADVVRFPINPESVAKQTGQPLNPGRARAWSDELATEGFREELDDISTWLPGREAQVQGKIYKQRTKDGIKRIEAEYGIKLNAKEVADDNYNEFLEIVLTPELKEAFKTVVYNRGGAVYKKPLMNLKY